MRDNTPVLNTTTLLLQSPDTDQPSSFVELLDFALVGANFMVIPCEIEVASIQPST